MPFKCWGKPVALLVAIVYVALLGLVPYGHGHGGAGGADCLAPCHLATVSPASDASGDPCPACQWELVSQAAPPASPVWAWSERVLDGPVPFPVAGPLSRARGLPSSRAPPLLLS
jgi:hypothetical protein